MEDLVISEIRYEISVMSRKKVAICSITFIAKGFHELKPTIRVGVTCDEAI